jgi:hypothetical protein
MTWETYKKFPVAYRRWLVERMNKEITKAVENNQEPPTKAPHQNTNEIRALTGNEMSMNRTTAPAMHRFR